MSPPTHSWLTVDEVAATLDVPLAEVYEAITGGVLPAQRYGQGFIVRRTDVDAYRATPHAVAG